MSRVFAVTGDYLSSTTAAVTAPPLTISVWIKVTGIISSLTCGVGVTGSANDYFLININGTNKPSASEKDTVQSQTASVQTIPDSIWALLTGVFTSHSSRAIFLNGSGKTTNSATRTAAASTGTELGGDLITGGAFPASYAHFALWNTALADSDVNSLLYVPPNQVQKANLVGYWPLLNNQSPEPDYGSGNNPLTVAGATFSTDNPVLAGALTGTLNLMGQAA